MFSLQKDSRKKEETIEKTNNVSKKLKKSRSQKENLINQRCKKCNREAFSKKKIQFCTNVCSSSRSKSKCDKIVEIDCRKGKNGKGKLGKCQRCNTKNLNSPRPQKSKPVDPERSLLGKKKKCREEKDVSNSCRKLLNKCNSRVFRATHSGNKNREISVFVYIHIPLDCDKKTGDKEWLKKKCLTKVFRDKFQSTCEELCADKKYSTKNPKACEFVVDKNPEDVETLEDIVSKCKDVSYKTKNKEKCEVVETIDVILASGEQTDKEENEVIEDNEASQVKNEVVKSIERQTTQERNNMKKKPAKDKTKIKREKNQIKEEKKHNQKKDKKKQTQKKNKKESDKQNNKNKGDKSKNQKKKVKSDREKSKCNKPKYAAMHPEECRNLEKMEKVIKDKCRKEKYRSKHKERCDMLKNAGKKDLANNVMNQVMDVRCQKESFRYE